MMIKKIAGISVVLMLMIGTAFPVQQTTAADADKKIMVNLASKTLSVYNGDTKLCVFPVGPGKVSTPSLTGEFAIFSMVENPEWVDPKDETKRVPSGDGNPLGYRWMGFYADYGIHGTNVPGSIGWYVSNGCIRMYEEDAETVFDLVDLGTPVDIYYDRLVIDRDADHTISYYIYPDGYGWQNIDLAYVNQALDGYGIADFVSNADINLKISASDGEPTTIGQDYDIVVDGQPAGAKAFQQGTILYVPVEPIAAATGLAIDWNPKTKMLTSPFGQVQGFQKKKHVYFNAADATKLCYMTGSLDDALMYGFHKDWQNGLSQAMDQGNIMPAEISFITYVQALYQFIVAP